MKATRRSVLATLLAGGLAMAAGMNALAADKKITLGFAQVGAESEWRTANTQSIKQSAKEAGINLKFSDAQQKQENQIKAIRGFIAQGSGMCIQHRHAQLLQSRTILRQSASRKASG